MVNMRRAVAVAFLLGSVALPASAGAAGASDSPQGSITQLQAATPADAGAATDLQTDYSWDKPGIVSTAAASAPVERRGWLQTLAQLAPALLILALVVLGLTITFTSLRKDMKQRRPIPYRPRGLHSTGSVSGPATSRGDAPGPT